MILIISGLAANAGPDFLPVFRVRPKNLDVLISEVYILLRMTMSNRDYIMHTRCAKEKMYGNEFRNLFQAQRQVL